MRESVQRAVIGWALDCLLLLQYHLQGGLPLLARLDDGAQI
jgi:hypothetical protein